MCLHYTGSTLHSQIPALILCGQLNISQQISPVSLPLVLFGTCVPCSDQSLSPVWLFATQRTVAHQAPRSMGILQARILEWVAMPSSRGSSQPRDRTQVFALQADSLPTEPSGKSIWQIGNDKHTLKRKGKGKTQNSLFSLISIFISLKLI